MFVPALNTMEVALHIKDVNGDDNVNTFWVKRTVAWTEAGMNTVLEAFTSWFETGDGTTSYGKNMSSVSSLESVTGRDFTTQHGFSVVNQVGLPYVGEGASTAVAAGLTKAITSRTGLAGKSYRGRTFLCSMEAAAIPTPENGQMDATHLTNFVLAFTPLIADVTSADADSTLVVASRYYQPGGPLTPTVPRATAVLTPVTSFGYASNNYDFQRRRAPGHARHH